MSDCLREAMGSEGSKDLESTSQSAAKASEFRCSNGKVATDFFDFYELREREGRLAEQSATTGSEFRGSTGKRLDEFVGFHESGERVFHAAGIQAVDDAMAMEERSKGSLSLKTLRVHAAKAQAVYDAAVAKEGLRITTTKRPGKKATEEERVPLSLQ